MPQRRRHIDFFAVMEALAQPGCPVCRLAERAAARFLQTLFYENVNDPPTRETLRQMGGFCPLHTKNILKINDALGSSIIYADLLEQAPAFFAARQIRRCPACHVASQAAQRALNVLLEHLMEEDVWQAYGQSDGLCLEHLQQLPKRKMYAAAIARLYEYETQQCQSLAASCREFVAKTDYQRRSETIGDERYAWQRAARKIGGGFPEYGTE